MDSKRFDRMTTAMGKTISRGRAVKLLAGGLAGGFAVAAGARRAGALPSSAETQNDFVRNCKASGGTSSSEGIRVIKCCHSGAFCTTCDFNFDPPSCKDKILRESATDPRSGPIGGVVKDAP